MAPLKILSTEPNIPNVIFSISTQSKINLARAKRDQANIERAWLLLNRIIDKTASIQNLSSFDWYSRLVLLLEKCFRILLEQIHLKNHHVPDPSKVALTEKTMKKLALSVQSKAIPPVDTVKIGSDLEQSIKKMTADIKSITDREQDYIQTYRAQEGQYDLSFLEEYDRKVNAVLQNAEEESWKRDYLIDGISHSGQYDSFVLLELSNALGVRKAILDQLEIPEEQRPPFVFRAGVLCSYSLSGKQIPMTDQGLLLLFAAQIIKRAENSIDNNVGSFNMSSLTSEEIAAAEELLRSSPQNKLEAQLRSLRYDIKDFEKSLREHAPSASEESEIDRMHYYARAQKILHHNVEEPDSSGRKSFKKR